MRIELHCHTNFSDGQHTMKTLFKYAKSINLDAVAITDHNTLSGIKIAKKTAQSLGLLAIPGIEIKTNTGHVLLYGIEEIPWKLKRKESKDITQVIDYANSSGAVMVGAHPFGWLFRPGVGDNKEISKKMHALEVINGRTFPRLNKRAIKLAHDIGKSVTAGSDAHILKEVGAYACETKATDIESILSSIRKNQLTLPENKTTMINCFMLAGRTKFIKKVK